MCYRYHEVYVAKSFPAYALFGNFYTATVANNAFIADTLVFTAVTFIVLYRTENPFAEQTAHFRLECSVVDRFRLGYLTITPFQNGFRGSKADRDSFEIAL